MVSSTAVIVQPLLYLLIGQFVPWRRALGRAVRDFGIGGFDFRFAQGHQGQIQLSHGVSDSMIRLPIHSAICGTTALPRPRSLIRSIREADRSEIRSAAATVSCQAT